MKQHSLVKRDQIVVGVLVSDSLVSLLVTGLVEVVWLFPAGVEAHGALVLQQLVHPTHTLCGAASKALLLGVAH